MALILRAVGMFKALLLSAALAVVLQGCGSGDEKAFSKDPEAEAKAMVQKIHDTCEATCMKEDGDCHFGRNPFSALAHTMPCIECVKKECFGLDARRLETAANETLGQDTVNQKGSCIKDANKEVFDDFLHNNGWKEVIDFPKGCKMAECMKALLKNFLTFLSKHIETYIKCFLN